MWEAALSIAAADFNRIPQEEFNKLEPTLAAAVVDRIGSYLTGPATRDMQELENMQDLSWELSMMVASYITDNPEWIDAEVRLILQATPRHLTPPHARPTHHRVRSLNVISPHSINPTVGTTF